MGSASRFASAALREAEAEGLVCVIVQDRGDRTRVAALVCARLPAMLKEKGIEKESLTREKFLEYAWEWKEKYGGIILDQLKRLGASCDWSRTKFTMDEDLSKSVIKVFIDLFMEKSFLDFIYWILLKSAESYYGESMKTEVPYIPYF